MFTSMICRECGKETTQCFSFDIDLPKFGYCRKHKKIIKDKLDLMLWFGLDPKFKYPKEVTHGKTVTSTRQNRT